MKKKFPILLCALLFIGLAVILGCNTEEGYEGDADLALPVATVNPAEECFNCHSGSNDTSDKILGAAAGYEHSGHFNGPRTLAPVGSDHMYVFHGSNAMYANGGGCQTCHTHQGFVDLITTGSSSTVEMASQPGCFTCHKPHDTGDFSLRASAAVSLADGSSYDFGTGNLCVNCHKSRRTVASYLGDPTDWPGSVSSHAGPHHGPQSDFIMGTNHWAYGSNSYQDVSIHASNTVNSCVDCHLFQPDGRLSGSLELAGHGMYLTAEVHGTPKDVIGTCTGSGCHETSFGIDPSLTGSFLDNGQQAGANWDGDATGTENKLDEIKGMRDTLITYFGTGSNFLKKDLITPGTSGDGPLVDAENDSIDPTVQPGEWEKDWVFASAYMTEVQAQSFWNFKYFMEDRSMGIHNPTFAAQILYDAIDNLNDNAAAGLQLGTTRP
jgi:hypothetical protein